MRIALTEPERRFLQALDDLCVRYLIVGVSAAVLQGADTVTAGVDLWLEDLTDDNIHEAARRAGGVWVPGHFGAMPPTLGGDELGDRFDIVLTLSGLEDFAAEYQRACIIEIDALVVHVLPLERVIHSKRVAGRAKDLAVLPALEAALAALRSQPGRGG